MPPSMTGDTCIVSHQPSHSLVTQQWWPQHKSAASCWGLHLHCHHDQLQGRHLHGDPPPHGHHLRQEADQERDACPGQECGADVWVGPQPGEKTAECVLLDINNKDSINLFIYYSFICLHTITTTMNQFVLHEVKFCQTTSHSEASSHQFPDWLQLPVSAVHVSLRPLVRCGQWRPGAPG